MLGVVQIFKKISQNIVKLVAVAKLRLPNRSRNDAGYTLLELLNDTYGRRRFRGASGENQTLQSSRKPVPR
jgi:hypothetical protein